jgi:hypothetical protein
MRVVSGYLWAVTAASVWLTLAFMYFTEQLAHSAMLISFWFGIAWLLTLAIASVPFGIIILLAIEFRLRSALFFGISGLVVGVAMTAAVRGGLIYPLDDVLSLGVFPKHPYLVDLAVLLPASLAGALTFWLTGVRERFRPASPPSLV